MDWDRDYLYDLEESEQRGEERGIQQKALQTAKAMKADNLPIEAIMKYTELSKEVILSI